MKIKSIAICSSASFYRKVLEIEDQLRELGFEVFIPKGANEMKKSGCFKVSKPWIRDRSKY